MNKLKEKKKKKETQPQTKKTREQIKRLIE